MYTFKLTLGVLFGLLVASITVLAIISYRNNQAANDTSFLVRHTHEVMDKAEEISSLYKDIQLESNAYYISKDPVRLPLYREAREMLFIKLADLDVLASGNTQHQIRIDSLSFLFKDLAGFTDSGIIPATGSYSEDALQKRITASIIYKKAIQKLINDIKWEEQHTLEKQEAENDKSIEAFHRTFSLLAICIAVLLGTTFFLIRYNFNRRIKAQIELKKANELFSKLFQESPAGIVISALDNGVIIDCNKAYAELVNYKREDIIGKTAVALGIFESVEKRERIIKGAQDNGMVMDIEAELKPRDKDPIWASISIQTIQLHGKKCLLFAILDMTSHKRAEEEIKNALSAEMELSKMKSNFVSLASHEFRTPLTTILSSAFLLENYSFGTSKDKALKHLSRIKSSVDNLTSILDEFLSLTKIEEGQIQPNFEHVNLKECMENICQNFSTFVKTGQHVHYNHVGEVNVYTDPVLVGNILNNLVSNAIKYSEVNKAIYVSTIVNSHIQIIVKDSGIGISDADRVNLFNRFYRGTNAGTVQGTGLGLHIMKHYVDMLNGSIAIDTEVGKGTEFRVTLEHAEPVKV